MTQAKPKPAKLVTCPACGGAGRKPVSVGGVELKWPCYRCDGAGVVARKAKVKR